MNTLNTFKDSMERTMREKLSPHARNLQRPNSHVSESVPLKADSPVSVNLQMMAARTITKSYGPDHPSKPVTV